MGAKNRGGTLGFRNEINNYIMRYKFIVEI